MNKKVALITGASSGIGHELARLLFKKGYSLILSGRNEKGLEEFKDKENVEIVIGDITQKDIKNELVNLVENKFKKLDILINNAGITFIQPFEENTEEQLNQIIEINLKTPILLTHELYPLMKSHQSGTIVFINSAAGKQGYANHTLYSSTKFGLNGFAQSLRLEAKKDGIRVLSIHPGGVKTSLYRNEPEVDSSKYMDVSKLAELIVYLIETEGLSPDEIVINRLSK